MGGWKLEIVRMSIYMIFPVGTFYYFNQPQYFEEWVTKTRQETFPPDESPNKTALELFIKERRMKETADLKGALERQK